MVVNGWDYAYSLGLQLGDRLVRNKFIFSKHHGIYCGIHNGVHLVAECQVGKGVQYVSLYDFLQGNPQHLVRIEKFHGSEYARDQIIGRINALIGTEYNLINFNCEHFSNLIQTGVPASKQVGNAVGVGIIAALALLLVGASK